MTDRTSELRELVEILGGTVSSQLFDLPVPPSSALNALVRRIDIEVNSNSKLLSRIEKLTHRKEFSNDPTTEIRGLADSFQKAMVGIKKDMELVQNKTEQHVCYFH